jgi:hypothetical protein
VGSRAAGYPPFEPSLFEQAPLGRCHRLVGGRGGRGRRSREHRRRIGSHAEFEQHGIAGRDFADGIQLDPRHDHTR